MKSKKNYLFFLVFFISLTSSSLHAINSVQRGLLVFLDDSEEEKLGAISSSLLTALSQHAGPIIASASILANIFSEYNIPYQETNVNQLEKRYKEIYNDKSPSAEKEKKILSLKALSFNPKEWVIKEINQDLYIVIPQKYLDKQNIKRESVENQEDSPKATDIELRLGLKVNHMKQVPFEDILALKKRNNPYADYFMTALFSKQKNESAIFCTHADYINSLIDQPNWTILLEGHGEVKERIVGLRLQDFKEVLDFIERKINCNLLVYISCYAAGLNTQIIFEDAQKGIQKTYPFAIVTQAITDAPTSASFTLEAKDNDFKIEAARNFMNFLNEATASKTINYTKTIENLFPVTPSKTLYWGGIKVWGNVPQIKFPGLEWFSVMASRRDIVSIGSILAKTHDAQKPLNIEKFFKVDPKAILLYASVIPFELVIDGARIEAILSMKPGDAIHKIKRISSTKNDTLDMLLWFMKIKELDPLKIFFIESVNNVNKVIIYNKKNPKQAWSELTYTNHAFYTQGNQVYVLESAYGAQPQLASENQQQEYLMLLNTVEGKPINLGNFSIKSTKFLHLNPKLNSITNSSIIEKIEGGKDRADDSIAKILNALETNAAPKTLLWIKELNGKYSKFFAFSLSANQDEYITLKDVIIDKEKGTFFTYQEKFYHLTQNSTKQIDNDYKLFYEGKMKKSDLPEQSELTPQAVAHIKEILEKKEFKKKEIEKKIKKEDDTRLTNLINELQNLQQELKTLEKSLLID